MKTIYKSIALEAALLSVTLALQAEIQSGGDTVMADVQANTLDRLKVTLVSPNVSGARDLVASGNATIDGNEIAVSLENLAFGTHRLVVSARFGTQIRTLYALDISVPQSELPNETQEYEDAAIVVSTYGDGGGGGEFPTDYAKQGDDPTATLTDTQAYAQAAAEAAQSLTSLDSDINAGKTAIAQAVTAKGVPTSPTDTMLQMATNVTQIAQAPISINGGDMYAKQLYGSLTTPNYWNLYDIMAQLLSDGRLLNYSGILLAEYYKGYNSLALSGAGAGGAYVVSDVDGNGNFIMYTEDTTHVWSTEFDGKGNRWVAYCFADEYHDFQITDTNTSPRSIHIGRRVGTITSLVNGRVSEVVVHENSSLVNIESSSFNQNFGKNLIVRNLINQTGSFGGLSATESVYIQASKINGEILKGIGSAIRTVILVADEISGGIWKYGNGTIGISELIMKSPIIDVAIPTSAGPTYNISNFKELVITTSQCRIAIGKWDQTTYLSTVFLNYITNSDLLPVVFHKRAGEPSMFTTVTNIVLQTGWCKPIDVALCTNLTEVNMYAHILQRLKQDESDCGDGVTITLGQTNLDKLTSEESVALLDDLTNIYGYTFA
jgi:hypothetical protein